MALQTSGAITISDIQGEFGGSAPHSLSEYYRGGAFVPDISANSGIPTSGTIKLSDFYGAKNVVPSSAPTITGHDATSNSLIIYFNPPSDDGGSPITDYQYRLNGGSWISLGVISSSFTISSLSPSTTYSVEMRAINEAGASEASNSINATTDFSSTGGSVSESGGYRYHTFNSSGTFWISESRNCDWLVVAGGAGGGHGGSRGGGGGGAGGMRNGSTSINGSKTVTVGGGGSRDGGNGSNSSISGIVTSTGGGAGGSNGNGSNTGKDGGSGGGGLGGYNGGAGISGQGNNGGNAGDDSTYGGGGGGGRSQVGETTTGRKGGDGGNGSSWEGTTYAGGGGGGKADQYTPSASGGSGGSGGGGNGAYVTSGGTVVHATSGQSNRGGGGGGQTYWAKEGVRGNGAAGGSGRIIIRVPL